MFIDTNITSRFTLILVLVVTLLIWSTIKAYAIVISIDGSDSEWTYNYFCQCCQVPLNQPQGNKEVRLCCEDPTTPTRCQLIWIDGLDVGPQAFADLYYARLFINASSVYFFTAIEPGNAANKIGTMWINFTSSNNIVSIKVSLAYGSGGTKPPLQSVSLSVYYNNNQISAEIALSKDRGTSGGMVYDFIEAKISGVNIPNNLLTVTLLVHKNIEDFAQTPSGSTVLNVFLDDNGFICGTSYDSSTVTPLPALDLDPLPIPEPWITAPVTMLITLAMVFVVGKKGRSSCC